MVSPLSSSCISRHQYFAGVLRQEVAAALIELALVNPAAFLYILNRYMSITMVFGSMVAGATSEGGAAVAFPVMTLVFGIAPPVARDFSFMIQSVGMTCASFTILYMGTRLNSHYPCVSPLGFT